MSETQHKGKFEYIKFQERRAPYYEGLKKIKALDYSFEDILEHYPCFVGHMTMSRFLGLYEIYKMCLGVAGHIGEVGSYKGASLLNFSKLVKIYEPEALTQVHGFDWFEGMIKDNVAVEVIEGSYKESYQRLLDLVDAQNLSNMTFVHKMDVTKELKGFLDDNKHMQFKLVFLDAGSYDVVKAVLPLFWERLTPGGILVLDQYNHELSPGETLAVREVLPDAKVRTLPNIWMPTAYIVK